MNDQYKEIKEVLVGIRARYISQWESTSSRIPVSERDIVSKIYAQLSDWAKGRKLHPHTEVKPRFDNKSVSNKKGIKIIDVALLKDIGNESWLESAKEIQAGYQKGNIEARYSSIPLKFFHTVIEVKIQSNFENSKKDILALKKIKTAKPDCNCFFVLLNALGSYRDHRRIKEFAKEHDIEIIEYTSRGAEISRQVKSRKRSRRVQASEGKPDKITSSIISLEPVIERLQKLDIIIKYLPKLRQYKFWPQPNTNAVNKRCYMIIEVKTGLNELRIHSTLKEIEAQNMLSNLGINLDVTGSFLNSRDQFNSAVNIDMEFEDINIVQKIGSNITNRIIQ